MWCHLGELGPRRLASAAKALRREHPAIVGSAGELVDLARALIERRPGPGRPRWWDASALASFRFAFPSRVTVRLRDGTERTAEASVPRGGAGNHEVTPSMVAHGKLLRCGPRLWGEAHTASIEAAIARDDAGLHATLGGVPDEERSVG